ncbi:MAG: pilus assembly protein [Planctomycetales bacterium]|nr:pilus assembly protein [Planctomycetales bacterium]
MEFAIVAPILVMMVWGAFEFTRFSMVRHVADNAAYEAARCVIVPGGSVDEAEAKAADVLKVLGIRNAVIDVYPTTIDEETPLVTVSVTVPAAKNMWGASIFTRGKMAYAEATLLTERIPAVQSLGLSDPAKYKKTKGAT